MSRRAQVSLGLFIVAVVLLGIAVLVIVRAARDPLPFDVGTPRAAHQIAGWIPYWDHDAAVATFKRHTDLFDTVVVFWYALRNDGSVGPYPYAHVDSSLIVYAHEHGVRVLALIANLPTEDEGGDWDAKRVERAIATKAARRQHVADIMALLRQHSFDGVNIDYEALRSDQRRNFSRFIKELSKALHTEGKLLGVSLHPKLQEDDSAYANGSQAQDWRTLARSVDHLYVMTYEEHWETSDPGPIASVPWMESILAYAASQIPPEKLFAGLPLYGYDWGGGERARGLTHEAVLTLQSTYKPEVMWNEDVQSWHFAYEADGVTHTVWFEDGRSVQAKLDLLERLGVANIALWRLGGEDEKVWDVIGGFARGAP